LDDNARQYSSEDSINNPEWHPEGIHHWDIDQEFDHIRGFRIAHNTTTVYEPCGSCGALYYRGPYHVVVKNRGILCHECAGRTLVPLTMVLTGFYARWHEHLVTFDAPSGASTRLVIGVGGETVPDRVMSFIESFQSFAGEQRYRTVHVIEGPDRFRLYSSRDSGGMQEAPLFPEKETPLDGLFRERRSDLLGVGYILYQHLVPGNPGCPVLLRTHEEWKRL
jgi:hypothetical protein